MNEDESGRGLRRDGVSSQIGQITKLESQHVCCFENNLGCNACFKSLLPARGTQTPLVAIIKTRKSVLWHGGTEVIALALAECQEITSDPHAHNMDARVIAA